MRLLILVISVSSILASSCTIQKRTFRNGYYVSWNKSITERKPSEEKRDLIIEEEGNEINFLDTKMELDTPEITDTLQQASLSVVDSLNEVEEICISDKVIDEDKVTARSVETNSAGLKKRMETEDEPQQKLDLFAANSLGFSLIYVGLLLLSIAMDLSEVIGCLAIFALLICIAFAIVSFVRKKRHPQKYKGTWMSVVALIILALATTVMFGFLISMI